MLTSGTSELVWIRSGGHIRLVVQDEHLARQMSSRRANSVRVSNLTLPLVRDLPKGTVLYRAPIAVHEQDGRLRGGPVCAILAGNRHFTGSRADFRDVIRTGREERTFVYVLPTASVSNSDVWTGSVRVGIQKWIELPCPHPESIYNRIPNRLLERTRDAVHAKSVIHRLRIPMFNPDYFNKAEIYQTLRAAKLGRYLPETREGVNRQDFQDMLLRNRSVYLKPAGGSIGHGIVRVDKARKGWQVSVLKNSTCQEFSADSMKTLWTLVNQKRLPGKYVMQAAVERILWRGRPCDFRVLAQKFEGQWQVTGKGVRVAGESGITTHVPNGGSIAACDDVLRHQFGEAARDVDARLEEMVLICAEAIDAKYGGELGEMSMDIGIDHDGRLWLFEANSKPMKFDEKDIRSRSLHSVIKRLRELQSEHVKG